MTQENIKYDDYNEDMERAIALNSDETLLDTQAWKENNIQQFLEEERNRYSKEYDNLIDDGEIGELEADDLLEDHDTRLINFILSEVEKEVEKIPQTCRKEDFFNLINNLRVKG